MPRKKRPKPRRTYRSGSISTDPRTGVIRARLPAEVDPKRTSRRFRPGQMDEALAWIAAHVSPEPAVPPTVTLGVWCAYWLRVYLESVPGTPPNTLHWARYALGKLEPLYDVPLSEVRASTLQERVGSLGVGAATVQGIVGYWRRCLDAAVYDERISRNPATRLTLPRVTHRPSRRFVTPQEARLLLAAIRGHRFEAAYALLIGCGLRIGEVLGLAWSAVDLEGRRAWIERQWTNSHWRDLPKSRRARWVTLPEPVVAALIRHHDSQPPGCVLVLQGPPRRYGGKPRRHADGPYPWSAITVGKDLAEIVAALELPSLTSHAARRGLSSALLDGRISPAVVADRLGHSSPATTLRHYSEVGKEASDEASRLIGEYLGETGPEREK